MEAPIWLLVTLAIGPAPVAVVGTLITQRLTQRANDRRLQLQLQHERLVRQHDDHRSMYREFVRHAYAISNRLTRAINSSLVEYVAGTPITGDAARRHNAIAGDLSTKAVDLLDSFLTRLREVEIVFNQGVAKKAAAINGILSEMFKVSEVAARVESGDLKAMSQIKARSDELRTDLELRLAQFSRLIGDLTFAVCKTNERSHQ